MSEDWRALGAEAARFLREGRHAEAAAAFEQVVAANPGHADSWFNLGYALRLARRYEAALDAYAEALARGVRSPEEAHLNRSVILSEHLHRTGDALDELAKAVAANPLSVAAWLNLGNLHEDLGEADLARGAYRKALDADPGNGRAVARLAAIDVHERQPKRAVATLRDAARRVRPGTEDAAEICFAMGSALDAAGDYRNAFAAVAEGNAIAAALREPSRRYDRAAHERLIDSLIAAFPVRGPAPPSPDDGKVIFICGMFRSGSTLAEQVLARHRQVTSGGELEFLPAMVAEDLQPYPQALAGASGGRLSELRRKYLAQVEALYPAAERVTDKRPDNFLHLGLIKRLFPGARIVHTVRQPLDNILSAYFLYFADAVPYSERIDDIVHYYAQYRRLMDHWETLYGGDICTVDYDSLVADPRPAMEALLGFLGLPWDEACIRSGTESVVRTASNWQVRQPLHGRSSGRWRNYAAELEEARRRLVALGLMTP